ncbi:AMED_5909 family protein [Amycolatopsis umgeniensis]|nr:AMED_5909 family protein [Amycolatopsis umgeniensis]
MIALAAWRRPSGRPEADMSEWLRFHQAHARMYLEVSEVDRWRHHELKYWVGYEERKAQEIAARMRSTTA